MRQAHNYSNLPSKTLFYFHISLPIPNCRSWTSLGSTVFTQIVFSYNYERLIRSINTPFCLHNIYTHYSYLYSYSFILTYISTPLLPIPSIRTPPFYPSLLIRSIRTYIRTLLFLRLYSYFLSYYSLSSYSLLLSPLYVHIIYTPFSQKIFSKKISTPKAYPKNFPKIFTYYNYSSPLLFNRKVNSSYSFYKILNTKFWRLYETIKTNGKNYYDFG